MTDLLWADPFENKKEAKTLDYKHNDLRNISCFFGLAPVHALLKKEKLISIVRGHQVKPKGYEFHDWEGSFPNVITIFSAPNYEGLENDAAVLISTDKGGVDVKTFNENPD
jgi:serine/threonine-protein phosphatase 2B catalytic subunit